MKNFFIITNAIKDEGLELTRAICSYIENKGGVCSYQVSVDPVTGSKIIMPDKVPDETECIFVIGGDGTLIRAARDVVSLNIPFIGINKGNLGYLCELEDETVFLAIDQMMDDQYMVEHRMMLNGYSIKNGKKLKEETALNDVVIHRIGSLQIVKLIVYVNGEYLYDFKADGIIVATATGSTGYNMSAGGPIVDPQANLILITPINSHTLNSKSIVLSAKDEIVIEIGQRHGEEEEKVEVSFDGGNSVKLEVGDKIVVHKAKTSTKILRLSKISFLEILRKKMQTYT